MVKWGGRASVVASGVVTYVSDVSDGHSVGYSVGDAASMMAGALAGGAELGALVGSLVPGPGTVIGGVVFNALQGRLGYRDRFAAIGTSVSPLMPAGYKLLAF